MEPPSSINADTGKQAGQRSDDPLSCFLSPETIYLIVDSYDELSWGRRYIYAYSHNTKEKYVYLGTLGLMIS